MFQTKTTPITSENTSTVQPEGKRLAGNGSQPLPLISGALAGRLRRQARSKALCPFPAVLSV